MNRILRPALLSLLVTLIAAPAFGHSTGELVDLLGDREEFFQAFDREVPDFTLSDAEGELHTPADFRGKVVVLHFVYASCPDVCPLHAEMLAEVQDMVNQTPMRELVESVSLTSDPANDTAEVMRAYGPAHGLDPARPSRSSARSGEPGMGRAAARRNLTPLVFTSVEPVGLGACQARDGGKRWSNAKWPTRHDHLNPHPRSR